MLIWHQNRQAALIAKYFINHWISDIDLYQPIMNIHQEQENRSYLRFGEWHHAVSNSSMQWGKRQRNIWITQEYLILYEYSNSVQLHQFMGDESCPHHKLGARIVFETVFIICSVTHPCIQSLPMKTVYTALFQAIYMYQTRVQVFNHGIKTPRNDAPLSLSFNKSSRSLEMCKGLIQLLK